MKKFVGFIICLVCFGFISDDVFSARRTVRTRGARGTKKRSAASSSGLTTKTTKKKSTTTGTKTSTKKAPSSYSKASSKSSSKDSMGEKLSTEEQCIYDALDTLLTGECSFLNDKSLIKELSNPLYCVYSYKSKTKTDSVFNYYLYQNYGIKEASVKSSDASVKISDSPKGAAGYYQYILDGLEDGSLSESKILDFITEHVLDTETVSTEEYSAIMGKSVESTYIVMNVVKNDIEQCRKATKKTIQTCGVATNTEIQEKIADSCDEYESALIKQTSSKKAKVMDSSSKLIEVLKQRYETEDEGKTKDTTTTEDSKDGETTSTSDDSASSK